VLKVHNKSIKRPSKGSNKESKRHPKRHPGLAHRTVSGAPGHSTLNSPPSGIPRALRYNSPDCPVKHWTVSGVTPDCPVCQWSNGYFARNGRLQPHSMRYSARQSQSTRSWRTAGQPRGPTSQSSNGQTPTVC
jgi:hypothetical protein